MFMGQTGRKYIKDYRSSPAATKLFVEEEDYEMGWLSDQISLPLYGEIGSHSQEI